MSNKKNKKQKKKLIHIVTLNNGRMLTTAESLRPPGCMMLDVHLYVVVNVVILDVTDEDNERQGACINLIRQQ